LKIDGSSRSGGKRSAFALTVFMQNQAAGLGLKA
jgi:hypothetical protein